MRKPKKAPSKARAAASSAVRPRFESEAEERAFWEAHDTADYVDWSRAKRVRLPNLKPSTAALLGEWVLDLGRTHYGGGADRRRRERFACAARGATIACEIDGERADGRRVTGRFTAGHAETPSPVEGVPDIDAVRLRTVD